MVRDTGGYMTKNGKVNLSRVELGQFIESLQIVVYNVLMSHCNESLHVLMSNWFNDANYDSPMTSFI